MGSEDNAKRLHVTKCRQRLPQIIVLIFGSALMWLFTVVVSVEDEFSASGRVFTQEEKAYLKASREQLSGLGVKVESMEEQTKELGMKVKGVRDQVQGMMANITKQVQEAQAKKEDIDVEAIKSKIIELSSSMGTVGADDSDRIKRSSKKILERLDETERDATEDIGNDGVVLLNETAVDIRKRVDGVQQEMESIKTMQREATKALDDTIEALVVPTTDDPSKAEIDLEQVWKKAFDASLKDFSDGVQGMKPEEKKKVRDNLKAKDHLPPHLRNTPVPFHQRDMLGLMNRMKTTTRRPRVRASTRRPPNRRPARSPRKSYTA